MRGILRVRDGRSLGVHVSLNVQAPVQHSYCRYIDGLKKRGGPPPANRCIQQQNSLGMLQRKQVRDKHGIKTGCCGGCDDCCVSFWCPCCGLLQQANEVEGRQSMLDERGYRPQGGMRM